MSGVLKRIIRCLSKYRFVKEYEGTGVNLDAYTVWDTRK